MFELFQVNESQGRAVLASMNTVLTLEGQQAPSDLELRTLGAIAKTMFHLDVDIQSLPSSFPSDLASQIDTEELQHEVLHFCALLPFLSVDNEAERMALVGAMAEKFGVSDTTVAELTKLAHGKKLRFAAHTARDSSTLTGKSSLGTAWGMLKGKLHLDGDKALREKFESYLKLPSDTLGHQMALYYTDNEFGFPGTPGEWASNTLHRHDFHHVGKDRGCPCTLRDRNRRLTGTDQPRQMVWRNGCREPAQQPRPDQRRQNPVESELCRALTAAPPEFIAPKAWRDFPKGAENGTFGEHV